ncbi:MAG: helix-turn-helix domain-containing protein [Nitrospirae bacterium]|nr:helix-turn-helix domain-containing protein [Nitrospirota bacterium]MCL5236328.1 helix-turn-helix domain-containing protein [Nitrospirota bacterium]
MRIERDDIAPEAYQAIAEMVVDRLRPLLSGNGKYSGEDVIFDKKTLAAYLHLSESTINKLVMNKQIPHFKIQAGQSGAVRFRQRDIDKWIQRQTIPETNLFAGKLR